MKEELVAILPRLRRFAFGLCWSHDVADDLVQAACERALRGKAGWTPGTRLDSWLYQIIRNLWLDETRRRRVRKHDGEEALAALTGEDGARAAETRLMAQAVGAAIADLPDDQREVMLLVCVEELSYREAADVIGAPIGTVMSRLARARKRLAEELERERPSAPREGSA